MWLYTVFSIILDSRCSASSGLHSVSHVAVRKEPRRSIETSSEKAHDSENEDTGCSDSEEDDRQGRWQSVVHCEGSSPFLLRKADV